MNTVELRVRVLMSLQVALLGMVTVSMRSVLVSWTDKNVQIRVVFDQMISQDEEELVSEIESEVISHLPEHTICCQAEFCPLPTKVKVNFNEVRVFERASAV
jgi:hypothetical protein